MFTVKTWDDAGKKVPLVRCNLLAFPIPFGPLPRPVQREVRLQVARSSASAWNFAENRGWWRMFVMALLPAVITGLPFWIKMALWPRTADFGIVMALIVLSVPVSIGAMMLISVWAASDRTRRLVARAASHAGYCGSCGYSLAGAAETDGRSLCSECGASWNRGPAGDFV